MVSKFNEQHFEDDGSYKLAYKHRGQVDCGGAFASSAGISSFRCIPKKRQISDGMKEDVLRQSEAEVAPGVHAELENMTDVSPYDNSPSALRKASSFSWLSSRTTDIVRSEHSKRPFSGGEAYQLACKRTRQVDGNSRVGSFAEIPPPSSTCEKFPFSVAADEIENRKDAAVPGDSAKSSPGSIFSSPWFRCSTGEDVRLEPYVRLSFFPGYFEDNHRIAGFSQLEEIRSPVFGPPLRKPVAIGPNHQALVPAWRPQCSEKLHGDLNGCDTCSTSSLHLLTDEDDSAKWIGTCVIPMPDFNSFNLETQLVYCKDHCCCLDEGSIRCVRQHVFEARETLREIVGQDTFKELGFCEMGEDVAQRWTEEEEQLFQEVVLSNPASLGRNFWEDLPHAFPSRSSKELVSYYFNVFILRKRAEQNRWDPLNVDSDNDEWQETDDDEFATSEEDEEDSGVESPTETYGVYQNDGGHGRVVIHEEADEGDYCDDDADTGEGDEDGLYALSTDKNYKDDCMGEEQDVQDDSCTSYEDHQQRNNGGSDSSGDPADVLHMQNSDYRHDGMSGLTDHEYIVGHCDPKPWEIGYIRGPEKAIDFLPTCNVIEEVFGKESPENSD